MDLAAQITELSRLHEQGTLDDDEFARAKARILDGDGTTTAGGSTAGGTTAGGSSTPADPTDTPPGPATVAEVDVPRAPGEAVAPKIGTPASSLYKAVVRARNGATKAELREATGLGDRLTSILGLLVREGLVHRIPRVGDRDGVYVRRPGAPSPGSKPAGRRQAPTGMSTGRSANTTSILDRKPTTTATATGRPGGAPSVGGWGIAVFLFGLLGGAVGYFVLKDSDPERASHVLKWGFIWMIIASVAWFLFMGVLLAVLGA